MKKMIFLFLLLSIRVFSQEKEVWIQKPMEAWPQIAMINEVWYGNGERYVHPSFEYVGTGFLIDTGEDTLAVTAKHVLWVAKTLTLNRVDINDVLQKWLMHPKGNPKDSVIIDQLINTDTTEILQGENATIAQRDWLVFSTKYVSSNIQPLKIRYTPVIEGEKIYYFGCPYDDEQCVIEEAKVLEVKGNRIIFSKPPFANVGGASGSPIVDAQGYLIGILGGSSVNVENGEPALYGITTHYLKKVLNQEQPLNVPLIPVGDVLMPIILKEGVESGIKAYHALTADESNYFIYNFSAEELNALGKYLLQSHKIAQAIRVLQLSVNELPWLAPTHNLLGQAYGEKGEKQRAVQSYERALALWPENEEAKKALEELKR